jgi:uncharacterized Fe-S center protein
MNNYQEALKLLTNHFNALGNYHAMKEWHYIKVKEYIKEHGEPDYIYTSYYRDMIETSFHHGGLVNFVTTINELLRNE